jgi:hypothetical protein
VPGKVATALQFATVTWALTRLEGLDIWLAVTALVGAFAAASYWRRELEG